MTVLPPRVKINSSDHKSVAQWSLTIFTKCYQTVCEALLFKITTQTLKKTPNFTFLYKSSFFFLKKNKNQKNKKQTSRNIQVSFLWLPVLKYANSIKARDDLQSSQSVFSIISRCQFNLLLLLPFYIIKRMSVKTCYLNDCFLIADIKQQSWENSHRACVRKYLILK